MFISDKRPVTAEENPINIPLFTVDEEADDSILAENAMENCENTTTRILRKQTFKNK